MKVQNGSLSLTPYVGTWDARHAGHLLRRTLYGPKKSEITQAVSNGLSGTLDLLLNADTVPLDPPINYYLNDDPLTPLGEPWVTSDFSVGKDFARRNCLRAWRMDNMLSQATTIHQKMGLFWFNHFAVEADVVSDARAVYELTDLFYTHSLGNFKTLVEKVTLSNAMLVYLNGNKNIASDPNENYARELFELFTVGKGPLIAEGNYTHYTETDIQQAAKVLSGFTTIKNPQLEVRYYSNRHNKATKTFSSVFNNHSIANQENTEYLDLINMLFQSEATARHICRKLYRWFLYYEINDEIESQIIGPMAQTLISSNFEIKPVVLQLLASAHFFDASFIGAHIKPPLDFVIGFQRQLEVNYPDVSDYNTQYKFWLESYLSTNIQLQGVIDPPDVAGWKAYYQEPGYYRSWISSVTLMERSTFTEKLLNGITKNNKTLRVDPFTVFDQFEDRFDPNKVVSDFAELLIPVPLSDAEKANLKESLLPGLPDFEWTVEYGDYVENPGDQMKKNAIQTKLISLIRAIKNLPQFQLS